LTTTIHYTIIIPSPSDVLEGLEGRACLFRRGLLSLVKKANLLEGLKCLEGLEGRARSYTSYGGEGHLEIAISAL